MPNFLATRGLLGTPGEVLTRGLDSGAVAPGGDDMSLTHPTARRNTIVASETAAIDAGGAHGFLKVYSGTPPGAQNAATGTLLVTINLNSPSFGAPANGAATAAGLPVSGVAIASGTAGYYRAIAADGTTVVHEGTVGTAGADLNFAGGVAFLNQGTVQVTGFTITGPL